MNTLKILFLVFFVGIVSCKCNKKVAKQTTTQSKMNKNSKVDTIPYKVLFDNDHCNIKEFKNVVITNKKELQDIYARINMTRRPGVPLPKIDFNKERVLGVFLGEKSTAGYQVKVDSIVKSNKELQVYYKVNSPKKMASMVITQPCLLVSIPNTESSVTFYKTP